MALAANRNLPVVTAIPTLNTKESLPYVSRSKIVDRQSPRKIAAIPRIQPLPTVKGTTPTGLDLPKVVASKKAPAIQPLPLLNKFPTSLDFPGKLPISTVKPVPRNSLVGQVQPLPTLKNSFPTSLDSEPDSDRPQIKILSTQIGGASWYGPEGGPLTATGERYIPSGLTAAHRTLPFGTKVQVTNLRNNQSVIVRINDRGPFIGGRIIDLSDAAAAEVGIKSSGVGRVRVDILSYGNGRRVRR
jgi:rare lipoprotein A